MGYPVSPIVTSLYMEYCEQKALSTAPNCPRFWHRFVDDKGQTRLPSTHQQFTLEENKEDGSILFLGTIVKPEADGTLSITVYRNPTHTDQYLLWDSNHHLSAKFSVIHTLSHRATTVCSKHELLQQERDHLRKALTKCKYPKWALDMVEKGLDRSTSDVNDGVNNQGCPMCHQ